MIEIVRDAQAKFQEIDRLLDPARKHDADFFSVLSEATQQAYITMNDGMCESTTVCHECAKHRDFLFAMLPVLEELQEGVSLSDAYIKLLGDYRVMAKEVLERISAVLSSL